MTPSIERQSGPFTLREYPLLVAAVLEERSRRRNFMIRVLGWPVVVNDTPVVLREIKRREAGEVRRQ